MSVLRRSSGTSLDASDTALVEFDVKQGTVVGLHLIGDGLGDALDPRHGDNG